MKTECSLHIATDRLMNVNMCILFIISLFCKLNNNNLILHLEKKINKKIDCVFSYNCLDRESQQINCKVFYILAIFGASRTRQNFDCFGDQLCIHS